MSVENCRYGKARGKRQEARVKRVWAILHFFTQFGFIVFTYLEGIDSGEALLVAATKEEANFYILTSDKRFLKALSNSNLANIKQRLCQRIICLEQLLINLISNDNDFDKIRRRIISSDLCNQNIAEVFADGKLTKKETALVILEDRVKELRSVTGDLLIESLPPPPIEIKTPDP